MQVSVENLGGLQRKMTVQVPAQKVENEVEQRLRRVGKTAKLKGFRPGKIPLKVIRQRYGGAVRREVLTDLVQSSYAEAVQREKLQPAGGPNIQSASTDQGTDLEYVATFEVYPEVVLKKAEGLKIERQVADIGDEDLDRVLESLREQRAHWHVVERAAAAGDRVNIDFRGTIDGDAFDGGEGSGVDVIPGSGQMLEEFEKGLIGASAGQQLDQPVRFPGDYPSREVAGRSAVFSITVNKVEEKHLPEVDDEFCAAFGIEEGGVDELRKGIRENMQRELDEKIRSAMREQILGALVDKNPVDVPDALVQQEVDQLRADAARRMGITEADQMPAAEPFREPARRRVALGLLVGKIVENEGLTAEQAEIDMRLQMLTGQFGGDPEQIARAYRNDPRLMNQIEMAVVEDKAVDWLIERAKIKDRKTAFRTVMQLDA